MAVLVIGGTGFLGRSIVEQLIEQHVDFTVLTRSAQKMNVFSKNVPYLIGDLFDYLHLDLSPYQQIINCSGEIHNEELMNSLHVDVIKELLNQVASLKKIHWLQVSSVGVYGHVKKDEIRENESFAPIGVYEHTKAEGELLIKEFCSEHDIPYTIIRPSNVFGCGMPNQSLAQLISMIKRGLFFYIGKRTDKIMMNYIPVEDVAYFVTSCLSNPAAINQDFIISDYISLSDFVQIVCEELKINNSFYYIPEGLIRFLATISQVITKFPLTRSRIDALTTKTIYSTDKAKSLLAFSPLMGLTQGLKNYIDYLYKES